MSDKLVQSSFLTTDGAYGNVRTLTGHEPTGDNEKSLDLPKSGSTPIRPMISGKDAAAGDKGVELPG